MGHSLPSGSRVTWKNGDSKLDRCTTKEFTSLLKDCTQKLEWLHDTYAVLSVLSAQKLLFKNVLFMMIFFSANEEIANSAFLTGQETFLRNN